MTFSLHWTHLGRSDHAMNEMLESIRIALRMKKAYNKTYDLDAEKEKWEWHRDVYRRYRTCRDDDGLDRKEARKQVGRELVPSRGERTVRRYIDDYKKYENLK